MAVPVFCPDGDYVLAMNGAGSIYSNIKIVESGVYELSFFIHDSAASRQKVANKFQQSI